MKNTQPTPTLMRTIPDSYRQDYFCAAFFDYLNFSQKQFAKSSRVTRVGMLSCAHLRPKRPMFRLRQNSRSLEHASLSVRDPSIKLPSINSIQEQFSTCARSRRIHLLSKSSKAKLANIVALLGVVLLSMSHAAENLQAQAISLAATYRIVERHLTAARRPVSGREYVLLHTDFLRSTLFLRLAALRLDRKSVV